MPVTLEMTVGQAANCLMADVADEAVIMMGERGLYIGLNSIGKEIWNRLETPCRVDALCVSLENGYAATPQAVRADILAFLDKMMDAGVVVAV